MTTTTYTLTGLTPETDYTVRVQANCGAGDFSTYVYETFTTDIADTTDHPGDTTGIADRLAASVTLYPNPAKEVVNVQCTMNNVQIDAVEVFDIYGKIVRTVVETRCTTSLQVTRIDVSGLADGIYFVRVVTEEGRVTKAFVKK